MRAIRAAAILMLVLWAGALPVRAAGPYFLSRDTVNLRQLLAPPPGPQDASTKADLDELRQIQRTRTPERVETARADQEESLLRFLLVFPKPLTAEQLPKPSPCSSTWLRTQNMRPALQKKHLRARGRTR